MPHLASKWLIKFNGDVNYYNQRHSKKNIKYTYVIYTYVKYR